MLRRLALLASALAAIPLALAWIISENILHPKPRVEDHTPDDFSLQVEEVTFSSRDGTRLAGWFIPAAGDAKRAPAILLSHGWARSRAELLPHADLLHRAGYNVLAFDYRYRGKSQGDACTLGLREQDDLLGALDFFAVRPEVDPARIGVLGMSTGGVVAIGAAARDQRLRVVVTECPFGSHEVVMTRSVSRYAPLPSFVTRLVAPLAKQVIERRVGRSFESADADKVIGLISPRPIFVIGDELDAIIGVEETKRLFERALEPKQFWLIPGADHARGWQAAAMEYERRVIAFLNETLVRNPEGTPAAGASP